MGWAGIWLCRGRGVHFKHHPAWILEDIRQRSANSKNSNRGISISIWMIDGERTTLGHVVARDSALMITLDDPSRVLPRFEMDEITHFVRE